EAVPVGVGAHQSRGDLGAEHRLRHDAESLVEHRDVEAAVVEELGDLPVLQQRDQVRRPLLAGVDLDHVGGAVTRRDLHDAEPVARGGEAHRLAVDRDRVDIVVRPIRQVVLVEANSHSKPLHAVSAARMRAQLLCPLWKEDSSYFSFGEWMRSSSSAKPTRSDSMPSSFWKSPTIGIEPPMAMVSACLFHSSDRADFALVTIGES